MGNVCVSVQKVKGLEQVLHNHLHQSFGEWARFAAWSLKCEQRGLERLVDQTFMNTAAGTFEAEHIDGMTDVLRSKCDVVNVSRWL